MWRSLLLGTAALGLNGCAGLIGPQQLHRDALHYNRSYQDSLEEQILLNLVRLRYRDNPAFLDVGSITANYEFRRLLSAELNYPLADIGDASLRPKIEASLLDKPTTTYSPLKGRAFVEELLTPVSIERIMLLNSSGWRIDRLLRACVQRLNRLQNAPTASGPTPSRAPIYEDFRELMDTLHQLEMHDAVHLLPRTGSDGRVEFVMQFIPELAQEELLEQVWSLLAVTPGTMQLRLLPQSANERKGDEVFVDTRSPLGVLYFFSHGVAVPRAHVEDGIVSVTMDDREEPFEWSEALEGLMRIRCTYSRPDQAAVSVRYRGRFFWVADDDMASKASFSLVNQLLALQMGEATIPFLTLQVN